MTKTGLTYKMNRNIALFGIYKIFTKRVFLPLITIYATQQAGLSIEQIGLTTAAGSLFSVFLDTPTGFWADKHGRRRSAQTGAALAALGSLIYVFSTGFIGILCASMVMAAGYSFLIGSMEALIHDSLVVLGKVDDYAKVASRAQSLSLIGNAILVATIPLLYPIDMRLPFVAGFLAYSLLFALASLTTEPPIEHNAEAEEKRFIRTVRLLLTKKTLPFFLCVGFVYAIGTGTVDVFNLSIIELGLDPKFLGFAFGGAALLGAVIGLWVHNLKRLTFRQYATFDLMVNLAPFIAFGIFRSLPVALAIFVVNFALWRYEQIMYQHYVLQIYGTTRYKATILSLMINSRSLNEVWIAIASTAAAKHFGLLTSIGYSSLVIIAVWPLLMFAISQFATNAKAESASLNQ